MPEGDTIARAATTLRTRLGGRRVTAARPLPLARLTGQHLAAVEPRGKHLYMRFSSGLILHTHMRMTGSWHVYQAGQPWRRAAHRATAVLDFGDVSAVLFAAPVCELIREDAVGRSLGPDILATSFDSATVLQRVRTSARSTVAEMLLDQGVCAGIGNIYRCEALWHERLDPLAAPADLPDEVIMSVYARARDLMRRAVVSDAFRVSPAVHRRSGRACPRCAAPVAATTLGRPPRILFWCPSCQTTGRRDSGLTPAAVPNA